MAALFDAAARFANEPDREVWASRLSIVGLDLRDLPALEHFCAFFSRHHGRLDMIVHNACQTIRRPPSYYAHLMRYV